DVVFEPEALAEEEAAPDAEGEFVRRVRIGAGNFQALGMLYRLLDPRRGFIALAFFSHKVVRWCVPLLLALILLLSAALAARPLFSLLLAGQLGLYALAAVGH